MISTKLAYLNQEAVSEVVSRGNTDESEQVICEAMEKASIDSIGSQKV